METLHRSYGNVTMCSPKGELNENSQNLPDPNIKSKRLKRYIQLAFHVIKKIFVPDI